MDVVNKTLTVFVVAFVSVITAKFNMSSYEYFLKHDMPLDALTAWAIVALILNGCIVSSLYFIGKALHSDAKHYIKKIKRLLKERKRMRDVRLWRKQVDKRIACKLEQNPFKPGVILFPPRPKGMEVKPFDCPSKFPTVGERDKLYLDMGLKKCYFWEDRTSSYQLYRMKPVDSPFTHNVHQQEKQ